MADFTQTPTVGLTVSVNGIIYQFDGKRWAPQGPDLSSLLSAVVHAATVKGTLLDADELPILDSANLFGTRKVTLAALKLAIGAGGAGTAIRLTESTVAPTSPNVGDMWHNTLKDQLYIWDSNNPASIGTSWNPADAGSAVILLNNNLTYQGPASNGLVRATDGKSSGKWYWEVKLTGATSSFPGVGVGPASAALTSYVGSAPAVGSYGYFPRTGNKYFAGSSSSGFGIAVSGDVIGLALDMDAGTLQVYKNGVLGGTLATGLTGPMFPMTSGDTATTASGIANFGSSPFVNTPPTGFSAYTTPAPQVLAWNPIPQIARRFLATQDLGVNVAAATSTSSVWNTRALNNVQETSIAECYLNTTNQINLSPGTYDFDCRAPVAAACLHRLAIYNVTDGTYVLYGPNARNITNNSQDAVLKGRLVLSSPKVIELRHYTSAAVSLGVAVNITGLQERYAEVLITQQSV